MIKQQNKVNFICIILCSILEIFGAIGAYATHYFTRTRMGMLRHMIYLNGKWEKALPIPAIKLIVICTIIALAILVYLRYRKKRTNSLTTIITMLFTIIISGWTVYFLLFYNTGRNRAYYILSICFILITVFQNILYHCISSIKSK